MPEDPIPIAETFPSPCSAQQDVTGLLDAWSFGDPAALDRLIPLVLPDLRRLARSFMARQRPGHTLDPTALVHEAYLRLIGRRTAPWHSRAQFFLYMSTVMRRILVNHARDARALKKGGGLPKVDLDCLLDGPGGPATPSSVSGFGEGSPRPDLLDLDRALRALSGVDPRQVRIVELRFFGGLTVEETARVLGVSTRTVKREWRMARLWLLRCLCG
ncbi:MAG: sigma-70 family RNA polymerase sigma factor [Acidobacteriota bacterium]